MVHIKKPRASKGQSHTKKVLAVAPAIKYQSTLFEYALPRNRNASVGGIAIRGGSGSSSKINTNFDKSNTNLGETEAAVTVA